jgi:phosphatidylinositol alpha-1,6-mannosyltransferase
VGGIQTYSKALADRLTQHCEAFGVLAPYHKRCKDIDGALPYPVYRIPVPTDAMRHTLLPFLGVACLRGGYKSALLAQWYSGAATSIAKRLGLLDNVFCAAHGQELLRVPAQGRTFGKLYEKHRSKVLEDIDGFFPVSRFTGGLLERLGVARSRIQVVCNGTNIDHFRLSDAEQQLRSSWRAKHGFHEGPLLLTAARLVRRKGIDTVLNALPLVVRQAPQVQYAIVGSGPERDPLEALSNELGMRDRVHFLGHLEDREVVIAYNECYAFVMPARYEHPSVEGFGLVFREANACGKPVVGARTGGVPDAIEHETTGLLVEPDDPSELSQALLRLLDNPSFARDLGQQGRRLVESSGTWEHATVAMLNFMQGSISQGATA